MDRNKNMLPSLIILAGLCILSLSLIYCAGLLKPIPTTSAKYTLVPLTQVQVAIIDNQTGEIYTRFFASNEGPGDWTKLELPN
jgi:hypothetical protein